MATGLRKALQGAALAVALTGAAAAQTPGMAPPANSNPALERRVLDISAELRCLVCQNQTIADSEAALAVDLRNQVRNMLTEGKSEREILEFMTARYGDFVLYRPPVKSTTALLWFGPPLLLGVGLLTLWLILRRRSRLAPSAFDTDDDELAAAEPAQRLDPR
ncbi:hypothetical protein D621_15285 [beta proteobacterium AAP51]|nr:hypothetical protein D621_15285 [beta proteobacterium AAP51]